MDAELFNKIDATAWEEFVRCYGPENRGFVRNVNIGEDDNGCWAVVYDFKPYSRFVEVQVNVAQNENMDAFCVYAHPEPQKTMPPVYDNVEKPKHYTSKNMECVDWIESDLTPREFVGYCKGNVLKYIWRYDQKGGIEDLKKAIWYLNRTIDTLQKEDYYD